MKGLILHCKNFKFKDIEISTRPVGISFVAKEQQLRNGSYKNKVVVLVCFEKSDAGKEVRNAAQHINHLIEEWHNRNNNVLVLPFAHLSKSLAEPDKAIQLIADLAKELENLGNKVELITFGTHKEWMIDVYGYPRATSWFQYPT